LAREPSRTSKPRVADPRQGWITVALVLVAAVLFGAFALPRLGPRGLEGEPAPDFALPVIHGGEPNARVRLSEQRGKPVLLDFWASWCRPCRDQARVIEAVRARYPDVVVLGVNVSDRPSDARQYLERERPSWIVVEDVDGAVNTQYGVETLPTLVAVDASGEVFTVRRRFVPERELAAILEEMGK